MATTYTPNYNLGKQEDSNDIFDMSVITANMDTIDTEMKRNADGIAGVQQDIGDMDPTLQQILQGVNDIKSSIGDVGEIVEEVLVGPPTLIEKSITGNGTYNASDDEADGYSSVTVNVSSSSEGDVIFYDYDGTVVQSYSAADFANLSAMPANPTHTGLTAQGWNWSLADAKTYVAAYGKLNIGQMYVTDDGSTRLHIQLEEGRLKPYLGLAGVDNGAAVSINWGDGSAVESVILNGSTVYTPHEYSTSGVYTISIAVNAKSITLTGDNTFYSSILRKTASPIDYSDKVYQNSLINVEIGTNVSIGQYAFNFCSSLTSITIPNSVNGIGQYAFNFCSSLTSVTIPNSVTHIGDNAFGACSLKSITIPNSVTHIGNSLINASHPLTSITIPNSVTSIGNSLVIGCYSLKFITIPNSVTSIGDSTFNNCSSLTSITIPNSVTSIGNNAFNGCSGFALIKFTSTTPPTVSSSNVWTKIPTDCIILTPALVSNLYMNGTNYPSKVYYKYIGYATYESGASLPTTTTDETHTLTWYATSADAIAQTNPITTGTGNEVYSRATPVA